jgi:hypothetical protein
MVRRRTCAQAPQSAQRRNSAHAAWIKRQDDQKLVAEVVRGLGLEPHSIIETHGQGSGGLKSLLRC